MSEYEDAIKRIEQSGVIVHRASNKYLEAGEVNPYAGPMVLLDPKAYDALDSQAGRMAELEKTLSEIVQHADRMVAELREELRTARAALNVSDRAHDALVARVADYETMVMQITRRAETAEERVAELEIGLEAIAQLADEQKDYPFAQMARAALAKEIEK